MTWSKLTWLDPATVRISRHPRGVTLLRDGVAAEGLVPVRACPFTEPGRLVGFRDREGATVAMLEDPDGLDPASRQALLEALDEQVFSPDVLDVSALTYEEGFYVWSVRTTCGARAFRTRHSWNELPVTRTRSGEILIRSEDGIRYRIRDLAALDERSRRLLFPVV